MSKITEKYGPWALVTGASSGMGTEFALRLAQDGLNVVLVARRKNRLDRLASELGQQFGIEVRVVVADLAREDFIDPIRAATSDIEVGLLVNSAGFATSGALLVFY